MGSYPTRAEARRLFADARDGPGAMDALGASINRVIVANIPAAEIDDEQSLLISWAFTLDAWNDSARPDAVALLACHYASILELDLAYSELALLGQVAELADRLVETGDRFLAGKLTPGAWRAFLANARLPSSAKEVMRQWSETELSQFLNSLRIGDYGRASALLDAA